MGVGGNGNFLICLFSYKASPALKECQMYAPEKHMEGYCCGSDVDIIEYFAWELLFFMLAETQEREVVKNYSVSSGIGT